MPQSIINYYGSVQPQAAITTADEIRYRALSELGKGASSLGFKMGADKRRQEGKIEGAKAGAKAAEEGAAIEPRGSLLPTFYNQAFNEAQKSSYVAGVDRSSLEHVAQLEQENALDVEAFTKAAEGYLSGVLGQMPEEYQLLISDSVNGYISRGRMRINNRVIDNGKKEAKSELLGAVETYSREASRSARNGEDGAVNEFLEKIKLSGSALVDGGYWTKEQADEAYRGARNETTEQALLQIVEDAPIDEAIKFIEDAQKTVPAGFSGDEYDVLISRAKSALQNKITEDRKGAAVEKSELNAMDLAIRLGIESGEGDPDELIQNIGNLFANGHYTPQQASALIGKVWGDLRGAENVWKRVEGDRSIVVDPGIADKVYKKDIAGLDDVQKVQYAAAINFVPETMKKELLNNIYSGDIQVARDAIGMVERMDEFQGFPEYLSAKDRAYIEHITDLAPVYGAAKAVDMARERTDPRDAARVKAREEEIKEDFDSDDWVSGAEKAIGPFWGSLDPDIAPNVQADYRKIFTANYVAGMSEGNAKKEAIKQIKRMYSDWMGRPMKYSPDKYYSINGSSDWVADDVIKTLVDNVALDSEIEDFYLIEDYATASMASDEVQAPGYLIRYKTASGWDILPGRYYPDVEAAKSKRIKSNSELVQKMREKSKISKSGQINDQSFLDVPFP